MILFVRNLVVKDFWLKLFSLAFAILIWVTVKFSIDKEISPWSALIGRTADQTDLTVPVFVPPLDGRAVNIKPQQVEVTLRGDPKLLASLGPESIRAQVNLMDVEAAEGLRRPIEMILPPGIAYTRLKPEEVEVSVSRKKQ